MYLRMFIKADLNNPLVVEMIFQRYAAIKTYINTIDSLRTTEDILLFSEDSDVKNYFVDKYGSRVKFGLRIV